VSCSSLLSRLKNCVRGDDEQKTTDQRKTTTTGEEKIELVGGIVHQDANTPLTRKRNLGPESLLDVREYRGRGERRGKSEG